MPTPTDLGTEATKDIAVALTSLLTDMFALYLKMKNFHWHLFGPHFRDYHQMLDEGEQIFAATGALVQRALQGRRHHATLDRAYPPDPAPARQRCR